MPLPKLSEIFSGGIEGLGKGFKEIVSAFKANPEKVLEHTEKLEQMANDLEIKTQEFKTRLQESEDKAVTDRWTADMGSDSWMSKNIRPLALASTLLFVFLIIITDSTKIQFEVKPEYIDLVKTILELIILAYFGGRTIEKGIGMAKKK
jgi:bisphosphoglycerate-independent phosphoglycerate mutase (AlkP superfamily)